MNECKPLLIALYLLSGVLCLPTEVEAQNLDFLDTGSHYKFDTWTKEDGIRFNVLLDVEQSPDGYIWITSYDGILRFDGTEFEPIDTRDLGIDTNVVARRMVLDHDGTLWISSENCGVFTYKDGIIQHFDDEEGFNYFIVGIFCDSKNRIWVSTFSDGLFRLEGKRFVPVELSGLSKQVFVNGMLEDGSGGYYFGTEGQGLVHFNGESLDEVSIFPGSGEGTIFDLTFGPRGKLWVATNNGVYYRNDDKFIPVPGTTGRATAGLLFETPNVLWMVLQGGMGYLNIQTKEFEIIPEIKGIDVQMSFYDLCLDREGNIWGTTRTGTLVQTRNTSAKVIREKDGLSGNSYYSVIKYGDDAFLASSITGTIDIIDSNGVRPFPLDLKSRDMRLRHTTLDTNGDLWISTYLGLVRVKPDLTTKWYTESNGLEDNYVRVTLETDDGRLFVGTRRKGLFLMNGDESFSSVTANGFLENALIMSIVEDDENNIWVGTSGKGIVRLGADGTVQAYTMDEGLVSNIVFNSYTDHEGITWVACNGGLSMISHDTIKFFSMENGLESDSVYDVVEDKGSYLWMPGNDGLLRISKEMLKRYLHGEISEIHYDRFDEYRGFDAMFAPTGRIATGDDGTLVLPCMQSLVAINPNTLIDMSTPPICHIKSFAIDGKEQEQGSELIVEPGYKRISFTFTGVTFVAPDEVEFQHRLSDFEMQWSDWTRERSVSYTNLQPGDYTLYLRARNNQGHVSTKGIAVNFKIKPGLYQQAWFAAAMILVVVAIVAAIYLLRVHSLKNRQMQLEKTVSDRTEEVQRQALDLRMKNQDLEAFSYTLSHDLKAPLRRISSYLQLIQFDHQESLQPEVVSLVSKAESSAKQMARLITDMLTFSGIGKGEHICVQINLVTTARSILQLLRESSPDRNVTINYPETMELFADPGLMTILLENLLNNAWKYTSECDQATITLDETIIDGERVFYVRDNGIGFDPTYKDRLFQPFQRLHNTNKYEGSGIGLATVRRIVEIYSGRIWAMSQQGRGSTFYFTLPVAFGGRPEEGGS